MKYRKKPVVIEAVQYTGNGNFTNHSLPDWIWAAFRTQVLKSTNGNDPLIIVTMEGELTVSPNDFIIQGIQGELYPCKPDIFEKTYEPVTEEDSSKKEG